jgi:hypothetical protein
MEITVRAYNRLREESKQYGLSPKFYNIPNYERILAFDTETRTDERQALTFGSFAIIHEEIIESLGLFYNPLEVSKEEVDNLERYCESDPTIKLFSLERFLEEIFYPTVYKEEVPCVGFNLPFDLSRLAYDYGYARGWLRGGFMLKLSRNNYPAIKVKHISSSESYIEFHSTRYSKFRGYFIDCQNLARIFTDDKHISLKEACKRYNEKHQKLEANEHGKIAKEYIAYNIEDTLATAELFTHLKEEYERFGVKMPLPGVFSSASIGKAFLEELGIVPYMQLNPNVSPDIYGKIIQAYYGGRCECRIRRHPCKVTALDFTSMYPTLFIMLGLYDFLIAERIDFSEDTANVQKLLEEIKLEDLQNPEVWKKFDVIAEVMPDDDLLPVRAAYSEDNFTVGFNYISSKSNIYYGLPSLILSKLLTGRTPKLKSAIRFKPIGKQNTLRKSKILGMEIDPARDNIFKMLVEEKQRSKLAKDGRDKYLKIVVNSSSYGIYMELNPEDKKSEVMIYSGNESFLDFKRFEREGRYFNPIIATLITDGAKLFLGIGDCILKAHDEVPAYLDTDSLYVSPQYADELIEYFDPLNPYDRTLVKHLLKIEEDSIWFYGISAKRYVLYEVDRNGNFVIKDDNGDENYSLHGLGHLLNPFDKGTAHWHKQVWLDILKLEYGKMTIDDLLNKYRPFYAISQFTVSTASLMNRFRLLNKSKSYNDKIKPFNFFMIGFGNNEEVKPIAPFSSDSQTMPYSKFINYKTGELMEGQHYFKSLADELWGYINHPEAKLEGNVGLLQRKHIVADNILYIGKEADKVEYNLNGLENTNYNIYTNPKRIEDIFSRTWKEVRQCEIPESQFYALKKQFKQGKRLKLHSKTLARLNSLHLGDKHDL